MLPLPWNIIPIDEDVDFDRVTTEDLYEDLNSWVRRTDLLFKETIYGSDKERPES